MNSEGLYPKRLRSVLLLERVGLTISLDTALPSCDTAHKPYRKVQTPLRTRCQESAGFHFLVE